MATKKKTKKRRRKVKALNGIEAALAPTQITNGAISHGQLGMGLLALAGGNVVGSIIFGNHALVPSALALGIGLMRKNIYWTMAGAGMFLSNGYKPAAPPTETGTSGVDDEVDGFDLSDFKDQVKERAKNFMANFAEKLYLPKPKAEEVSGLNGEEEVNYFLNPYMANKGQLDLRELDKVQAQIAQMNGAPDEDMESEINY